jgi:DNA polymerase III subunit alpha
MNYIPLHTHTHYSLLDGLSKPEQIAAKCAKFDMKSCAITDHGSICGAIQFYQKLKKQNIKPILGIELYICANDSSIKEKDNAKLSHMLLLAKNINGWKELIKMVSQSNHPSRFYHKPRLSLDDLAQYNSSNFICMTGHTGSVIANDILDDNHNILPDAEQILHQKVSYLYDIFGKENVFIECQQMDKEYSSTQSTLTNFYRQHSSKYDMKLVATCDAHYVNKQDAIDQRILLCNNLKTTLPEISKKDNIPLKTFFESDNYYLLTTEEMKILHTEIEIANTNLIDSMCENYDILVPPQLPKFTCPNGVNETEFLYKLCGDKLVDLKLKTNIDYTNRLDAELNTINRAGLSGYFLIVKDIVDFIKNNNWLPGPGRGSAAGSLVSYLLSITSIDPIKYDLLFERFYNDGRNTKDRISMPDIDVDVPIDKRERVIQHMRDMYGVSKVSQMITFNTLKGRGALKEVLRVYGDISFDETNKITENIPDEAKIADELQEMKEEYGEASIIRWSLENDSNKLQQWCFIDSEGNLDGPLSKRFEQAIRLEGTKCHQSKHAAGVAVSAQNLDEICPMIYDNKTQQTIAGLEMADLESLGVVKFDILGVALLDKIMNIRDMLAS